MGLRDHLIQIQLAFSEVHDLVKRSFRVNEANPSSSHLTQLEERVMLSATPLPVVDCPEGDAEEPEAEVCVECPESEDVRTEDEMLSSVESMNDDMSSLLNESIDIVLIDSSLSDVDVLVDAVDESAIVLLYDGVNGTIIDVLAQVEALSETTGSEIASLSILSHGDGGQFDLGGQVVTTEMTAEQQAAWQSLADNFTDDANIYVYGCEVVDGSGEGQQLLDALSLLTGTEVYGSVDTTGFGGDWDLEAVSSGGEDELAEGVVVPFNETVLSTYEGTLAVTNLVAHWTFDDGSGQTLTDVSGNGNDVTLGTTTGSDANDPTWTVDGTRGSVFTFDGSDDYLTGFSDSPAGNFTVAGWGNTTSGGASGFHALYSADDEIWLGVNTSNGVIYLTVGGENDYVETATGIWTEDTWHHLAGTWDGTTAHIYLDGSDLTLTTTGTLNDPNATTGIIGAYSSGSEEYWEGSIDDLAIFDEALDSTTINKLANDNPLAVDSVLSTDESVAGTTGDVLSTSFEPNGDTLSIDSFTQGTDGTVVYNNNGTFTYTPDANFNGVDTFTYTITDGNSNTDTATITVTVNDVAPTITSRETVDSDNDGQIDQIKITTDQNLDDDFSGLTITVAGYSVTGYSSDIVNDNIFYVDLTESGSSDTGAVPLVTVMTNTTLSDATGNSIAVAAGVAATDKATPVITSRETIDSDANGQIDQIKITTSENLDDDFSGLTITVAGYTVSGYSSDIANDNIFYVDLTESGSPDTGVTPSVTVTANTTLSDADSNDIATDGGVAAADKAAPVITASQSFNVSELATNMTSIGTPAVSESGLQSWMITAGNSAGIFAINSSTGEITVTDNTNLDYEMITSYSLTLTVSDGVTTSSTETVTINIDNINEDPTNEGSLPSDIAVTEDVASDIDLSSIDLSDVDAGSSDLTITLTTSTGGNITASAGTGIAVGGTSTARTLTGSLTDLNNYFNTPSNLTYLHGTSHTNGNDADTINVKVNDNGYTGSGGGTDIDLGTVNIDISAVNDLPTTTNNTVSTDEDVDYVFSASDFNYSDIDGDLLASVQITSLETVGALQLSGSGVVLNQVITRSDIDAGNLTFAPVMGESGTGYDSFEFSVNDGTADSVSSYAMTVDVTLVNTAPTATGESYSILQTEVLTVTSPGILANDQDVDGDPLTAVLVSNVSQGVLSLSSDGSFTYTPDLSFFGTDSFTYSAFDGLASSPVTTVTIEVEALGQVVEEPVEEEPAADPEPEPEPTPEAEPVVESEPVIEESNTETEEATSASPEGVRPPTQAAKKETASAKDAKQATESQDSAEADAESEELLVTASQQSARGSEAAQYRTSQNDRTSQYSRSKSIDISQETAVNLMSTFKQWSTEIDQKEIDGPQLTLGIETSSVITVLSIGYVIWSIRGGLFLTSFVSVVPTWSFFDPLPILNSELESFSSAGEEESLSDLTKSE